MLPRVRSTAVSSNSVLPKRGQGLGPVDGLGHTGRLVQTHSPNRLHGCGDLAGQPVTSLGCLEAHDRHLAFEVRVFDPVVEAAPLEGVVHVTGAIRRQHHERRHFGSERPELGDRHRVVGQDLEQERLEFVVGPVDLVDDQHRRGEALR